MFSLDSALSSTTQMGMPVPGIVEIYGRTHVGKSTLAYHLASQMNKHGRVVLCDFEGLDMDYIRRAFEQEGFDGTLKVVSAIDSKGKLKSHESMLDELTEEHREIISLARIGGMSHAECAAATGRSEQACRQLLRRALIKLELALEQRGLD